MLPHHHAVAFDPVELAPETFLLRQSVVGDEEQIVYLSSMLIRGAEPVLVDTGPPAARDLWLEHAWDLVDPADVRWVFVSHDDVDHVGNVTAALAACPNATMVTSWFAVERLHSELELPPERMRWCNDGDTLDIGDRVLDVIAPPLYDSPTTRGLFDRRTKVYWAADGWPAPVDRDEPEAFARQLDHDSWVAATTGMSAVGSPWVEGVRPDWLAASVDRIRDLGPTAIASAHGPIIDGDLVTEALDLLLTLPGRPVPATPRQADLEALLRAAHG